MSSTTDCVPLQQLRTDLSGDCCSWTGVTCDKKINRVTAVRWSNTRLTGTIPSGLGGLTNLTELDLSSNQLTGSIPPDLGNLKNLRQLELNRNKLSGPIPGELGGLDSVSSLSLGNNELGGQIPESLTTLPKLSYLYLYHNSLVGPLTKLPNPSSGCSMISTFNENNKFGCVPQGATGKCAADLIQNKVPECDANGNPAAPGTAGSTTSRSSASPTNTRGAAGSRSTQTGGASTGGEDTSTDSAFPPLAIASIVAAALVLLGAGLLAYRRQKRRAPLSDPKLLSNPPMPSALAATAQPQHGQAHSDNHHQFQRINQSEPLAPFFPPPPSPSMPAPSHAAPAVNPLSKPSSPFTVQPPGQYPPSFSPMSPGQQVVKPMHEDQDTTMYLPPAMPAPRPNGQTAQEDLELILPPSGPSMVRK